MRKYFIFTSIIMFFFTLTIFTGCGTRKDGINNNNSISESNVNIKEDNEASNNTSQESIAMEAYQKYLDNKEYYRIATFMQLKLLKTISLKEYMM